MTAFGDKVTRLIQDSHISEIPHAHVYRVISDNRQHTFTVTIIGSLAACTCPAGRRITYDSPTAARSSDGARRSCSHITACRSLTVRDDLSVTAA